MTTQRIPGVKRTPVTPKWRSRSAIAIAILVVVVVAAIVRFFISWPTNNREATSVSTAKARVSQAAPRAVYTPSAPPRYLTKLAVAAPPSTSSSARPAPVAATSAPTCPTSVNPALNAMAVLDDDQLQQLVAALSQMRQTYFETGQLLCLQGADNPRLEGVDTDNLAQHEELYPHVPVTVTIVNYTQVGKNYAVTYTLKLGTAVWHNQATLDNPGHWEFAEITGWQET